MIIVRPDHTAESVAPANDAGSLPPGGTLTRAGPQPERGALIALREVIARLERKCLGLKDVDPVLTFGVPQIDPLLGGGLAQGVVHEITSARESELPTASGFTIALAARSRSIRPLLWIAEDNSARESGIIYALGLEAIGLSPEQVVIVKAQRPRDVLWAMEEAVGCSAVGTVVGEFRSVQAIDTVASRRLSLAAGRGGVLAIVLRANPDPRPLSAATRWIISPAPSPLLRHGVGPPSFVVRLVRNRFGPTGSWILDWNRVAQCFALSSTHPQSVLSSPADRPAGTALAG